MTRRYASTAVSGTRRACSHSCSDRKLSPNCRANSDWAKPRPPRTSRTRRANSSACTSRIAPASLFPLAECFGVDGLLRVTGTPLATRRLLAVPACRRELNRTSHSSRKCQACTRCQHVSGNSTLLAHRRAFPFRDVPIVPFESRPFRQPLGARRVAPQCFVLRVRSPLQATDALHGGKMSSFGWALPLFSLYVNDGVAWRRRRVTFR